VSGGDLSVSAIAAGNPDRGRFRAGLRDKRLVRYWRAQEHAGRNRGTAVIAGTPWLDVYCPGCGTSRAPPAGVCGHAGASRDSSHIILLIIVLVRKRRLKKVIVTERRPGHLNDPPLKHPEFDFGSDHEQLEIHRGAPPAVRLLSRHPA
jgi:hypothetical protein